MTIPLTLLFTRRLIGGPDSWRFAEVPCSAIKQRGRVCAGERSLAVRFSSANGSPSMMLALGNDGACRAAPADQPGTFGYRITGHADRR
jgi:hypothetical protein